jgi:hypothetical protein
MVNTLHQHTPEVRGTRELTRDANKQVQTPQQRRANEAFAKKQETKRGKNEPVVKKAVVQKSPVSKFWLCKLPTLSILGRDIC